MSFSIRDYGIYMAYPGIIRGDAPSAKQFLDEYEFKPEPFKKVKLTGTRLITRRK